MPAKKPQKGKIKRRVVTAAAVGLTFAAGFSIKVALHNRAKRAAVEKQTNAVLVKSKLVRNSGTWSKICPVYNWNPTTAGGIARIKLIESVSKKTKVAPERILLTLESNYLDSTMVWHNRLNSLERQLSTAERISNTQKGLERRHAKFQVKSLSVKIGQANRVIAVLNGFAENPTLAKQIQKEVLASRGSLAKMKKLSKRK